MSRKEIVVSNVSEEHSNPIAELVQVACRFDSDITLESNNRRINAKSIMGIMAFNPSKGMTVNIVAEGSVKRKLSSNGKVFSSELVFLMRRRALIMEKKTDSET